MSPGSALIQNNIIAGNSAAGNSTGPFGNNGGGINVEGTFTNTSIIQNLIYGNSANHGGGVYFLDAPAVFINNTVANNDASQAGSALYGYFTPVGATIANNLFIAKPGESALGCDTTFNSPYSKNDVTQAFFVFNDVFSSAGSNYINCTDLTGTFGNISADPQFVNPTSDFHLQSTSPAIDAGSNYIGSIPSYDLDSRIRSFDGRGTGTLIIDLGAYEFSLPSFIISSLSPNASSIPAHGTSSPVSFQMTPIDGFAGQVSLSCTQLPPGASCAFSPSSVLSLASGPIQGTVTIISSGAPPGTATIMIVANSAGVPSKSQVLPLTIYADYNVTVSNPTVAIFPGQTAMFQGQVASADGYTALVTLQCGLGQPSTCTPTPTSIVPSLAGTPFTVMAGTASPGDYAFSMSATGHDRLGISFSEPLDLKVVDFNLTSVLPSSITVPIGGSSAPLMFNVTAAGPFAAAIMLSCSGSAISAGATCSFSPSNVLSPRGNAPVFVTLVVNSNGAGAGSSTMVVTATSLGPPMAKTASFNLTISPNPDSADLSLNLQHVEAGAIPVGRTVTFTATVQNSIAASSVPAVMVVHFSPGALLQNLPAGCNPMATEVLCSFTATNGSPNIFSFPATVSFVRNVTATATVSSSSGDSTPGDNFATDTAPVRPRPFARFGLPPRIP